MVAVSCCSAGAQEAGMAITRRRMTLEEFLRLPEEKPALEFLEGTVTQKVSPQGKHGRLHFKFAERLGRFAELRKPRPSARNETDEHVQTASVQGLGVGRGCVEAPMSLYVMISPVSGSSSIVNRLGI
jgi:hypothetical protein